jgi:uncharacterized surface protein with fasciclin (FAS1) repeats
MITTTASTIPPLRFLYFCFLLLLTVPPPHIVNCQTIANVAGNSLAFSTMYSLLNRVGLLQKLRGDGPFTVFIPSNVAFREETNDDELSDDELRAILLYHIVEGVEYFSSELAALAPYTIETALVNNDINVTYNAKLEFVVLNGMANVTSPDVPATNGIIHVIEHVLIPPNPFAATVEPSTGLDGTNSASPMPTSDAPAAAPSDASAAATATDGPTAAVAPSTPTAPSSAVTTEVPTTTASPPTVSIVTTETEPPSSFSAAAAAGAATTVRGWSMTWLGTVVLVTMGGRYL